MVTGSYDRMLCLWDLKTGIMLKKMEGNRHEVRALAVSRDGQLIASGGDKGEIIIWHGETGEHLVQVTMADSYTIFSLDFSPDGTVLASGSMEWMTKFWSTATWKMEGNSIESSTWVNCIRYSPSGKLLAIATNSNLKIYNSDTRECVADMRDNYKSYSTFKLNPCHLLAWTLDGTRLLSMGGSTRIQEWDTLTWQEVSDSHWTRTGRCIRHTEDIVINPTGTLVASASVDKHVYIWRLSDQKTIAIFQHSAPTMCVTFSVDGKHILSGGGDKMISEWVVPEDDNSQILIDDTAACGECIAKGIVPLLEEFTETEIHRPVQVTQPSSVRSNHPPRRTPNA
jgi:hypothetical protein